MIKKNSKDTFFYSKIERGDAGLMLNQSFRFLHIHKDSP